MGWEVFENGIIFLRRKPIVFNNTLDVILSYLPETKYSNNPLLGPCMTHQNIPSEKMGKLWNVHTGRYSLGLGLLASYWAAAGNQPSAAPGVTRIIPGVQWVVVSSLVSFPAQGQVHRFPPLVASALPRTLLWSLT